MGQWAQDSRGGAQDCVGDTAAGQWASKVAFGTRQGHCRVTVCRLRRRRRRCRACWPPGPEARAAGRGREPWTHREEEHGSRPAWRHVAVVPHGVRQQRVVLAVLPYEGAAVGGGQAAGVVAGVSGVQAGTRAGAGTGVGTSAGFRVSGRGGLRAKGRGALREHRAATMLLLVQS